MRHDPYVWIDPFEMVDQMEAYFLDLDDERERRLHWALAETARHRSLADQALRKALAKYDPMIDMGAATAIMDTGIAALLGQLRR